MPEITIRDAVEEDLHIIHMIEEKIYQTPWTFNFFRIMFHTNEGLFIVATSEGNIVGYTIGEIEIMGRADMKRNAGHVMNVAVQSDYQGKGVGTMLLDELEVRFIKRGASVAYLEVRESNTRAQQIYRNRGYHYVRTSENYYSDEDGYIMTKRL